MGLALLGLGFIFLALGTALATLRRPLTEAAANANLGHRCVDPQPVDFPAPDLHLTNLDGLDASLDDFGGQVVLLNAWASWCPPCRAEMPDLQTFYEAHAHEGLVVVAVNIGESREIVAQFLRQERLTFPVWLDPTEATLRAFQTISLPYSAVIDRAGVVRFAWSGSTCLQNLESRVAPMIHE